VTLLGINRPVPKRRRDVAGGLGGTEPASQPGTSAPDAKPPPAGGRGALRRLVVTPTFFAGACIVLVAALAYGTTQTHLAFRGLGPICAATSCSATGQGRAGVPYRASATPEKGSNRAAASGGRAVHPAPAAGNHVTGSARHRAAHRTGASSKTGKLPGHVSSRTSSHRSPVVITYRTVRAWHGGFLGAMTITNRTRSAIPNWLLWVHYRRARLDHVWGARWYPASPHVPGAGVVAPQRGQFVLRPGASARFTFRVSGHPGPPGGCFFDTTRCRFRRPGRA
jgi:cellulose binding protein with CBM2 domain